MSRESVREMKRRELRGVMADHERNITRLERALIAGSMTLDYGAVRGMKDELESARNELAKLERKEKKLYAA